VASHEWVKRWRAQSRPAKNHGVLLTGVLMGLLSTTPVVGDVAPDFTVTDVDGNELSLSKLVERGPVVLAFFPKAFTPG
jgi:peroxiredoxin